MIDRPLGIELVIIAVGGDAAFLHTAGTADRLVAAVSTDVGEDA